jgi:membrane associated rhomboid family serine protease
MTTILLVTNVAAFVLQSLLAFYSSFPVTALFALSLQGLAHGFVWQLITFQFMHGGLWHLVFNLIAIYFFGRAVEEVLGGKVFLRLYLACGVIGGLVQMLFALLLPAYFGGAVVGASAGGFGLIAAFAAMFPERQLTLLLFFVIPVSMRAKTLLWISIGLALFGIIVPNTGIADAAHLGGIFAGWFYIRQFVQGTWNFPRLPSVRPSAKPRRELVKTASARRALWRRPKSSIEDNLPSDEFISREVDPILDKISEHGIQSLTDGERRILEAARAKMSRR